MNSLHTQPVRLNFHRQRVLAGQPAEVGWPATAGPKKNKEEVSLEMKNIAKLMLALSIAMLAGTALTACDDDDAASSSSSFVLQNN